MKLDVVTHCWNYSRLLSYHLSSLILAEPKQVRVQVFVAHCRDDERTVRCLERFRARVLPDLVKIIPYPMEHDELMRRAIGRNRIATATSSHLVWFSDADIVFGRGTIDSLQGVYESLDSLRAKYAEKALLLHPRSIGLSSQEDGDKLIEAVDEDPLKLWSPGAVEFVQTRQTRAIGGSQIVTGETAREFGYCRNIRRYQRPQKTMGSFSDDTAYRRTLGTGGLAVDIPNVFRIRHSTRGYLDGDVQL